MLKLPSLYAVLQYPGLAGGSNNIGSVDARCLSARQAVDICPPTGRARMLVRADGVLMNQLRCVNPGGTAAAGGLTGRWGAAPVPADPYWLSKSAVASAAFQTPMGDGREVAPHRALEFRVQGAADGIGARARRHGPRVDDPLWPWMWPLMLCCRPGRRDHAASFDGARPRGSNGLPVKAVKEGSPARSMRFEHLEQPGKRRSRAATPGAGLSTTTTSAPASIAVTPRTLAHAGS
jgi:hypothetical protein